MLDEEKNDKRIVMHFHPAIAPFKAAVLPLSKKLNEQATEVFAMLSKKFNIDYDDAGSIGKRYRRQDEIGTPYCITYDFDSVEDNCVTVRDRDTMEQVRLPIDELVKFHKEHGHIATMTAVSVGQRFGCLGIEDDLTISSFREKSDMDGSRINAGFMVLEPKIFDYIEGDSTVFEKAPLETVASMGELDAYIHNGFWKPMDTLREKMQLEEMWANGTAPWKVW